MAKNHIKNKKTALGNFDKELISIISEQLSISEKEVEETIILFFFALKESMNRGMNFDFPMMKGHIPNPIASRLRKQRIGDQKKLIKCIRYGIPITYERMQTLTFINKIKKQYEQSNKRQD